VEEEGWREGTEKTLSSPRNVQKSDLEIGEVSEGKYGNHLLKRKLKNWDLSRK